LDNSLSTRGAGLESWIGSADPMTIGPFPHNPSHVDVRRVKADVGIGHPVQDVDRGGMIRLPHHPAGAVKPIPTSDTKGAGCGVDL
jgi:hypothetical protein